METPPRVFPSRQASLYGKRPEPMKRLKMWGRTRLRMQMVRFKIIKSVTLHGQTGRFTVAPVNKIQDSGRFRPGNKSVPWFSIYQGWLWRNGTQISIWNVQSGKTGLPFRMIRCSRKCSTRTTPKRRVPLTFPAGFSGQFLWMVNNHNDISCSANEEGTGKYVTR